MLRVLDLFSGIGGFSLGLERTGGFETAAFCEIEKYPVSQLKKNFPGVPIYDDIKTLTAERLVRDGIDRIDVITGGYPCQPFSVAGKQRGEKDDRHLWPSMLEIIAQVRPTWVICENVTGHIALGLDQVLLDLETEGYSSRTFIIPACSVNAPHRRDRLWIVAYSDSAILEQSNETLEGGSSKQSDSGGIQPGENALADTECNGLQGVGENGETTGQARLCSRERWNKVKELSKAREIWAFESSICRVVDGFPGRVARLKALGNAVVPQICMIIGQAILDYEQNQKV